MLNPCNKTRFTKVHQKSDCKNIVDAEESEGNGETGHSNHGKY